ncbi:hypothetical protein ABT299_22715 [Spirillospora sp. NPDC000708]
MISAGRDEWVLVSTGLSVQRFCPLVRVEAVSRPTPHGGGA